jgi:HK97 family phage portal protein
MSTFWSDMWARLGGTTTERNAGIQYPQPAYAENAAVPVTEDTAMQMSAVWACVRLLSETVASLPFHVYKRNERVIANDFYFQALMARKPNRYQTRQEFLETMMLNLTLHGNAYAKIQRINGKITSLLPMMSAQVEVSLLTDGAVVYQYSSDNTVEILAEQSVWHIKLNGNGIIGKSPIAFGRNMIGIAQAAEKTVTKIYNNGGKRSGVLSLDKLLKPEQRDEVRKNFGTMTTGTDDRLLVLEMGMEFEAISMSPQDIELLASRKYQIDEIARWFGVPSIMINHNEGTTTLGSSAAEIISTFYKLNLRPYLERIEASIECNLFTKDEQDQYIPEFDFEGLLRSDFKSRLEGYRTAIAGSVLTPNEARKLEGLDGLNGGDNLLSQVNMSPLQNLGVR